MLENVGFATFKLSTMESVQWSDGLVQTDLDDFVVGLCYITSYGGH